MLDNPEPEKPEGYGFDELLPREMAWKAQEIGVNKANMNVINTLALAVLAGAFIALGCIFFTVSQTGIDATVPWGWGRVLGGVVFSLGLILTIVGGAELFTGNNLIIMAWASKRLPISRVFRNWVLVYLGNYIGATLTAVVVFCAKHYQMAGGDTPVLPLSISA